MKTMNEIKAQIKAGGLDAAIGLEFTCPTGAIGRVLPGLSIHQKPRAEISCIEEGCSNTHIREVSDWHQCGRCVEHAKPKKGGRGRSGSGSGLKSVKLPDGTVLRELKILETDDEETRQLKEENNLLVLALAEAEKERRGQEAETKKAEAAAKREAEKAQREVERARKAREEAKARALATVRYAQQHGLPISPTVLALAEEAEAEAEAA